MERDQLKKYIRKFRDKYLFEAKKEVIFTEPLRLVFCEYAIKKKWITTTDEIDKSYLMKTMAQTLREDVEPEDRPDIQLIACSGTTRTKFTNVMGYSNKVLTGFQWRDQSLSSHCYDTVDILGEYKQTASIIIKRQSQYLHPEYPLEDAFTKMGRVALLKRIKSLDYDIENINHNRNVIHLLAALLAGAEEEIDFLRLENKTIHQKLDDIISKLSKNS